MNSFYGGKEGRTYHIVKRYNTIEEMVNNFAKGAAYPDVSYGQYVIIDTVSKNDINNGRLYRRGINYSQSPNYTDYEHPGAGAIYIGQIVGPDGKVPKLSFVDISYIEDHQSEEKDIISFDGDRKDAVELDENNQIQENPIQIGYVNEFNEEEGKYEGKIGIDIPKSVVKIDAQIVSSSNGSKTIQHSDIANNKDTFTVAQAAANPLHQHSSSIEAVEDGINYYDYKLAIPIPDNFNIIDNRQQDNRYDAYGKVITPFHYYLKYKTVENKQLVEPLLETDIEVPVKMGWTGDLINYTTNKGKTVDIFNPNGQFHLYAWLKDKGDQEQTKFSSVQDAINYLNQSSIYQYGIRIPTNNNLYDLTQAGWLIAVQIYQEGSGSDYPRVGSAIVGQSHIEVSEGSSETKQKTCLFAFDYTLTNGQLYLLDNLKDENPSGSPQFKGWFLVQDFNTSLAADPITIVLVGDQIRDVTTEDIQSLRDNGVWFYGKESEAKWW